jgi:uncharacterized protein (DUF1330 family)
MNVRYKIGLAVVVGAALGSAAVQGLHAQAKPKAYVVSETEVLDAAALATYVPLIRAAIDAAGGRRLASPGGKTVAFVGEAPKRVAVSEWESLEKAQAFQSSEAYKNLAPQRDKATKTLRSYAIESAAN